MKLKLQLHCSCLFIDFNHFFARSDLDIIPKVCEILDFRHPGDLADLNINGIFRRKLQYEGELCEPNVLEVALKNPILSTFTSLLEIAGLSDIFLCAGPFTALAPTNQAWDPALVAELSRPENKEKLRELLLYHILVGARFTNELQPGQYETLLKGENVTVRIDPIRFNQAGVVIPDELACNGVIQAIDDVLSPDSKLRRIEYGQYSVYVFTLFLSTNNFGKICVVYLIPFCAVPNVCEKFEFEGPTEGQDCRPNILDVARENPDLTTMVGLIDRADLADIFSCAGPFTGLWPTNSAFNNIDPAWIYYLLRPENKRTLQGLLLYHFLPGFYPSRDLEEGPLPSLIGVDVFVSLNPLMFNSANVLVTDILSCNGISYILDGTLLPPDSRKLSTKCIFLSPLFFPSRRSVTIILFRWNVSNPFA